MTDGPGKFAPNAAVYEAGYYARMYRPHWFLRNRRKYEERDAALLRIVRPSASTRLLEVGSARGDTAFFFALRVGFRRRDRRGAGRRHVRAGRAGGARDRECALRAGRRARPLGRSRRALRRRPSRGRRRARSRRRPRPVPRERPDVPRARRRPRDLHAQPRPLGRADQGRRAATAAGRPPRRAALRTSRRSCRVRPASRSRTSSSPRAPTPFSAPSTARSRWSASAVSGRASGR